VIWLYNLFLPFYYKVKPNFVSELFHKLKIVIMKTKLALLLIVSMFTIGLSAQKMDIKGTWKMIESSGHAIPEEYTQLKFITDTHFMWALYDSKGNIISGAGGKYTLNKDEYTENITMVLPGMKPFLNKKAVYKVVIKGKTMEISGYLNETIENKEVWEKID